MPDYTLKIEVKNVAEGDVTDLAQRIWDAHATDLDAAQGDFELSISQGGFTLDWQPDE